MMLRQIVSLQARFGLDDGLIYRQQYLGRSAGSWQNRAVYKNDFKFSTGCYAHRKARATPSPSLNTCLAGRPESLLFCKPLNMARARLLIQAKSTTRFRHKRPICPDDRTQEVLHLLNTAIEYDTPWPGVAPMPKQPAFPATKVSTFSSPMNSQPSARLALQRSCNCLAAAPAPSFA